MLSHSSPRANLIALTSAGSLKGVAVAWALIRSISERRCLGIGERKRRGSPEPVARYGQGQ